MGRVGAVLGGVVAAALAATVGMAPAFAGLDGHRFQVTERKIDQHWNDIGKKGPSIGDTFTLTDRLFHRGSRVGRDAISCEVVQASKRKFRLHCFATLSLRRRGDITAQGLVTFKRGHHSLPDLAITGGTGQYGGASGFIEVLDTRGEPDRLRVILQF